MLKSYQLIKHCPRCGTKYPENNFNSEEILKECPNCQYKFYQNSVPAAAAIIPHTNRKEILLCTRNIDPGKGLLDICGGFCNYNEDPKETIKREIKEELGLELKIEKFLTCKISDYIYQDCINSVLNLIYISEPISELPTNIDRKEIQSVAFYNLQEVIETPGKFAFPHEYKILTNLEVSLF